MNKPNKTAAFAISSLALAALAACGGGGSGNSSSSTSANGTGATTPPPTAAIALLAPAGPSAGAFTPTGNVIADSIAYANSMRLQLGLKAFNPSATNSSGSPITDVTTAAANHALYMYDNNYVGHYETSGLPGYTGYAPSDRVTAAHYVMSQSTNSVGEIAAGIGGAFTSSTQAVDGLFDAPFHRAIFLFDTTNVGFGQGPTNTDSAKFSTLVGDFTDYVQNTPDNILVAYPYNGQTNVKPSWVANESPNPVAAYNNGSLEGTTVGYPVTLSAAGNGAFSNIVFTITDAAGNAVPCIETDNTNNTEATRLAMCVPNSPLANNTVYKVAVTGSLTNTSIPQATAFSVSWSFTTGTPSTAANKQIIPGRTTIPTILN
ncbi:CAP domain-containing protein [Paraburkholderia sp. BL21I4N1]|uniref:CAP domain-containing protein n=1 Tax=Paraburkholderia sp. BL21I4N1 TaxID=1938801 RepID=UPI000D42B1F4|nr:CAP domain-containing protein [Paraburkholderia sp. BL21I4N1]PQV48578.1 hypothetical protein B0G83_108105 [Paraburkholderia sp. BL21I4N1]